MILGAFGAHGLAQILADQTTSSQSLENLLNTWDTAVLYHAWHSFAILLLGVLGLILPPSRLWAGLAVLFFIGIVMFSGSLYGLVLGAPKWLGPVTPMGGVCFILGWIILSVSILRTKFDRVPSVLNSPRND